MILATRDGEVVAVHRRQLDEERELDADDFNAPPPDGVPRGVAALDDAATAGEPELAELVVALTAATRLAGRFATRRRPSLPFRKSPRAKTLLRSCIELS